MAAREDRLGEPITLERFRALPESDECRYEVRDGRLLREPRPRRPHGTAVMLLGYHLTGYALEHGGIVTTETGFILGDDPLTILGPNLAYVREDPAPFGDADDFIRRPPDLAVEVASPSDRLAELRRKAARYLQVGTAEVWIVYSSSRRVEVHRADEEMRTVDGHGVLSRAVLPGLEVPVPEIFRF